MPSGGQNRTHGQSSRGRLTPEYRAWAHMLDRIRNPRTIGFKNYGGRGLTVHERYLLFENFFADLGPRPSPEHSLDRIDNNSGYTPGNLRWATRAEQNASKRTHGIQKLSREQVEAIRKDRRGAKLIASEYDIHYSTVWRIRTHRARVTHFPSV